jgi:hypothetical protein
MINFVVMDIILHGHATYNYYSTYQSILIYNDTLEKGIDYDTGN